MPKARLFTARNVSVGLSVPIFLPTGLGARFLGDGKIGVAPRLILAGNWEKFGIAANIAYHMRPNNVVQVSANQGKVGIDDELYASLGGRVTAVPDLLDVIVDGRMNWGLKDGDDVSNKEERSGEILGGLRFHLPKGFKVNLAGGGGLGKGFGTPTYRVIGGLHWMPVPAEKGMAAVSDDADGDGLVDSVDACPTEPEDLDGFEDQDGCPETDNDGDGILDTCDKCPNEPEDKDEYNDADGCPDADNDNDGLLDGDDQCPNEPEDKDEYQDTDGCPDPDNDGDGVLDVNDKCPKEPETVNGTDDDDGCPDVGNGPVKVQNGKITVPPVYFATGRDRILRKSYSTLEMVAKVLKDNKWVKKVRIEGHTDSRGSARSNKNLSDRRAHSVLEFLVNQGVEATRFEAQGFGEEQPIASNRSRRGRASNRRVEFVILDPAQK